MMVKVETMHNFAKKMHELLRNDRDVMIGVAGFTGEGKSTFTSDLAKEYSQIAKTHWGFDRMTWSRQEMMDWIDGKGENKEGQLPEYSIIVPDELFAMFYARQWYESEQIDAISTFNMCRDRHLLIIGNVPKFWSLDAGFLDRVRFYVYIPYRGVAWVYEQENNPFTKDAWNVGENLKRFRKSKGDPSSSSNFICEIHYKDMTPEEKEEYLHIRNTKRVQAIGKVKEKRTERNHRTKKQRNNLIKWIHESLYTKEKKEYKRVTQEAISKTAEVTQELVSWVVKNVEIDDDRPEEE